MILRSGTGFLSEKQKSLLSARYLRFFFRRVLGPLQLRSKLAPPPSAALEAGTRTAPVMERWSQGWLLQELGIDFVNVWDEDELNAVFERAIDLLRTKDTKSGYQEVYPVGRRWQAKPYVSPGKQRSLGLFATAREAAGRILEHRAGTKPLPPSPKARRKRGEGRQPRSKRARAELARIATLHALPKAEAVPMPVIEVGSAPPSGAIVVPCYPMPA